MKSTRIIRKIKIALHPKMLKNKFLRAALKGNDVECPCCGGKYITFLPAGLQKRPNAKCIKCGSLERHRAVWLFLKERGEIFTKQIKLLHMAPEKLYYQKFSALSNIDYHPIDLNPGDYDYGAKTKEMDVTALTYADETFDALICSHVLEHIPDDAKAMREMFRVLKPGAWAIINVPMNKNMESTFEYPTINDPKKQEELFGQPDHVRIYGRDYITRLTDAGFKVDVIDYTSGFSHNERFRYGLKAEELIFYCTK